MSALLTSSRAHPSRANKADDREYEPEHLCYEVGYRCRRCSRTERFGKAVMLATYGDMPTGKLLELMAQSCPQWGKTQIYELCGAMFILPWKRDDEPSE